MNIKNALAASVSVLALLAPTFAASAQTDLDALYAAAKAEGQLTTIALPHDWCGYGAVIDGFKAKYPGITVNELNPDAGSGDEIEAIKANKGNTGPQAPDVIDVGLSFGPSAKAEGLIQPYKVSTWDTIPDSAKDADGYWYGDYYGVLAFHVNNDIVKNVADRLGRPAEARLRQRRRPRRRSARLQPGDPGRLRRRPRRPAATPAPRPATPASSSSPSSTRPATSCRSIGKAASLAQGTTPIVIAWDYNALAWRDGFDGNPTVEVVVPKTGVVAGVYVQAISAYAPHPNAAKLWMEYLYSDEGQLGWLEGLLPPDPLQRPAPRTARSRRTCSPSCRRPRPTPRPCSRRSTSRAPPRTTITEQWDTVVGANVQ